VTLAGNPTTPVWGHCDITTLLLHDLGGGAAVHAVGPELVRLGREPRGR
jgi:hypothetical protein